MTFPVASGLFADWLAFGLGSLTVSNAMRLFAHSYTFRTVEHLASFIRAFNLAFGFLAFHIANCVFRLSAGSVTFGRLAYGVADSGTVRVVAFP